MKLSRWLTSQKYARFTGLILVFTIVVCGALAKAMTKTPVIATGGGTPIDAQWIVGKGLKARAALSQNKVLTGSDGIVYLQIDVAADGKPGTSERKPTDFVVVLDRSGSMMDGAKMDYAHDAIEALLKQMGPRDRFALVDFDDTVETAVSLTAVTSDNLSSLIRTARDIAPRGGTNLGGGLSEGIRLIRQGSRAGQSKRVILLSDGLANVGVIDPKALGKMADQAVAGEFAVSTIGLGLDFNETLMSSLADHGLGNYHFLESTSGLDAVLAKEFTGAGEVFAQNLEVDMNLASGVSVVDASGYPVEERHGAFVIRPGQMLYGQTKTLYLTLKLPTAATYAKALGTIALSYKSGATATTLALIDERTEVACLPMAKKAEVTASINQPVYENAWTQNEYGRLLKNTADGVRAGDEGGALSSLNSFKGVLQKAYDAAPSPKIAEALKDLDKKEDDIKDAFSGADQEQKQKRLSKTQSAVGSGMQRK